MVRRAIIPVDDTWGEGCHVSGAADWACHQSAVYSAGRTPGYFLNSAKDGSVAKNRIRVGVIFGGRSGEHEISLRSARSIMDAIDKDKYDVLPIGITKEGQWIAGGDPMRTLTSGEPSAGPAALLGEPGDSTLKAIEPVNETSRSLTDIATIDVFFPVLHGPFGEDGTVQGLLELADVPYVGSGVAGSAVGMDKVLFKAVMQAHHIPVLPYQLVLRSEWEENREAVLERVMAALDFPVFVKPANLGSSVGVTKARDREQLADALDEAARYDRRLLVERGISAREIEVSVLGNEHPIASVPGEVVPGDEFYSYKDKYLDDKAQLLIPAPLDEHLTGQVRALAVASFKAIDAAGLARCDFLLDRETGELWMNEINTIPGFTSISMYPKLWEASGIPYPELIDRLIQLALERHADKKRSKTTYEPES
ncbi:MAG: D-alanine--D-alanine ligase [Chloroflexi bacterium]|nr:D-alanine--D-alanine ligase [Chloroflexota bacterium]